MLRTAIFRTSMTAAALTLAGAAAVGCGGGPASSGRDAGPGDGGRGGDAQRAEDAGDSGCTQGVTVTGPLPATVSVAGDTGSTTGISDPSVVVAAGATSGAMVYSSVLDQHHIHTRIAGTADSGRTWTFVSDVNQNDPVTIQAATSVCGTPTCTGRWNHEVASLVVDPTAPAAQRYRVFTHTYFTNDTEFFDVLGYISLYTASAPTGPWTETKLLGWNSALSPDPPQGVAENVSTDATLAPLSSCLALTEPGALLHTLSSGQPVLDLALGCIRNTGQAPNYPIDVVLLRSTDGATSFQYVSTPITGQDSVALGFASPTINGADLFDDNGEVYLFASPSGPIAGPSGTFTGYTGCLLFEFADLDAGALVRCGAAPALVASYRPPAKTFLGACTFASGAVGLGVAGDQLDLTTQPVFRVAAGGKPPF